MAGQAGWALYEEEGGSIAPHTIAFELSQEGRPGAKKLSSGMCRPTALRRLSLPTCDEGALELQLEVKRHSVSH